ncbi:MAG: proline dehydrogenase family protein [Anaerolineales bacterium]|nr:proline dehydrogenase family protein [Anaerolineales bacterium]
MLRSILIYFSRALWAQRIVSDWGAARKMASRFVAGEGIEDALRVIEALNEKGIVATLDHLGEHTSTPEEANLAAEEIIATLDALESSSASSNVSIKLTQIGLGLDESLCERNLERILTQAKSSGNFVRIDMEDTPFTDKTISLYERMLEKGFKNISVGMVIQSYLYRSEEDVHRLLQLGARIRLVKGAYQEPVSKAFPKKLDVDANFDLLTKHLIDAALAAGAPAISDNGRIPPVPAIATHDEKRIDFARQYAQRMKLSKNALEFQMLYGIRRNLQEQLSLEGFPVRVYVPFGVHWYPYFMRRLAERPANLWFFVSNLFRN